MPLLSFDAFWWMGRSCVWRGGSVTTSTPLHRTAAVYSQMLRAGIGLLLFAWWGWFFIFEQSPWWFYCRCVIVHAVEITGQIRWNDVCPSSLLTFCKRPPSNETCRRNNSWARKDIIRRGNIPWEYYFQWKICNVGRRLYYIALFLPLKFA